MGAQPSTVIEPRDGAIVSKATIRAAERLTVPQAVLADVLGISEATVSRIKSGAFTLDKNPKAFELALLFIRLYRSLDAIVGGDQEAAASWMRGHNTALKARPIDAIQSITGLIDVVDYLDARRAPI